MQRAWTKGQETMRDLRAEEGEMYLRNAYISGDVACRHCGSGIRVDRQRRRKELCLVTNSPLHPLRPLPIRRRNDPWSRLTRI